MKQLEHENIIPFYGVSTTASEFCLVFPWYNNGNIMEYLQMNPNINQFELASTPDKPRTPDAYLHLTTVIGRCHWIALPAHKPSGSRLLEAGMQSSIFIDENSHYRQGHILIDDSGTARLATGGRSSIVATPGTSIAAHDQSGVDGGNASDDYRYTEPEILSLDESQAGNADKILATKEGDVYGMGMVVYEASNHCLVFI